MTCRKIPMASLIMITLLMYFVNIHPWSPKLLALQWWMPSSTGLILMTGNTRPKRFFPNKSHVRPHLVFLGDIWSPVRYPLSRVSKTMFSVRLAAYSSPRPYFKSIVALRTIAKGFSLSWTAISGAEPMHRFKNPWPRFTNTGRWKHSNTSSWYRCFI